MKNVVLTLVTLALVTIAPAQAQPGAAGDAFARLSGFREVPSVSTTAEGRFRLSVSRDGTELQYELRYSGLEGDVTQSHIHFGQPGVNGGIVVFLCTNLGNGPAGTPACPPSGTVSGTLTAADMVGAAAAQGIAPGELDELLRALRNGVAYVNVHSSLFPGGEIRGQLQFRPGRRGDD